MLVPLEEAVMVAHFHIRHSKKRMENGSLNIPPDSCLPGTNIEVPFPLKKYLMRPYPGHQSSRNGFMKYYRVLDE